MALTLKKGPAIKGAGAHGSSGYGRIVDATFDSSYPTGGEPLTASDLQFDDEPSELLVQQFGNPAILVEYTGQTELLKAYWGNAGTASVLPEVTNTTDLSAQTVRLLVAGRKPTSGT